MKKLVLFLAFLTFGFSYDVCEEKTMRDVVNTINRQTPMGIDMLTTLLNLTCINNTFYYRYTIHDANGIKFSELNNYEKGELNKSMYEQIVNSYCSTPETLKMFNTLDKVVFNYYLENGTFFMKIEIEKSDCY
ncbi:hypothetical protein [uncultured Campylobacter sp.]|uniref:hypothetical protein n=1 Tax=uncultured Campylobacter sp. TaxID=218934 RepID=UPI002607DECF|nr:hypothetical protein [uncultured Campylobacter sp.]